MAMLRERERERERNRQRERTLDTEKKDTEERST